MGRGGIPQRPNSQATRQGLDQRSEMEEVVPKMACREARMRDSPERGDLDSADDISRRCKKDVTVAAKSGEFTAGETGKGQFL